MNSNYLKLVFLVAIISTTLLPIFNIGGKTVVKIEISRTNQVRLIEWINMHPTLSPDKKNHLSMSFDQSVEKLILFSGRNFNGTDLNDTWAYDFQNNNWEYRNPLISAPHRQYSDMTYISSINKSAIFGGAISGGIGSNDFWLYDYNANLWEEVVSANPPPIRNFHSIAYSPIENKLIIVGGQSGRDVLDDTWIFNFDSMSWAEIAKIPLVSSAHSVVYNPKTNTVLLFNGQFGMNIYELDFISNSWSEVETTNKPYSSQRTFLDLVYDPVIDKFIQFGGYTGSVGTDETWLFDYNTKTWYFAETENIPPPRHTDSNMEFDSLNNVTILFGGSDETIYYSDTWVLSISPDLDISSLHTTNPNVIIPTIGETPSTATSENNTEDESPNFLIQSTFLTLVFVLMLLRRRHSIDI